MAYSDQPERYGGKFAVLLGGYGLSRLLGAAIWLPALVTIIANTALNKLRPVHSDALRWAIAMLIGHVVWMAAAVAFFPEQIASVGIDIVIGLALAIWLTIRPNRVLVWLVIAFELLGLAFAAYALLELPEWTAEGAGLAGNVALRLLIVGTCAYALVHGLLRDPDVEEEQEVFA